MFRGHGGCDPRHESDPCPLTIPQNNCPSVSAARPNRRTEKLSRLEMLFVALALLALFYLGSLGARRENPWIKAAQAELQARTQLAQPPRRHLAVAEDD